MKQIQLLFIALLVCSSVSCQNNYLKMEMADANKLFEINSLIFNERNYDKALSELDLIRKNVPDNYSKIYSEQKRFWDKVEYNEYIEVMNDSSIPFILDAYSKVFYFYAVIHIDRGNWELAESYLLEGLKHTPNEPHLLCEMGMLYQSKYQSNLNSEDIKTSCAYFINAIEESSFCSSKMTARALRGLGFNFIEIGEFDSAEMAFISSLDYDEHPYAHEELKYIKELRKKNDLRLPISTSNTNSGDIDITSYKYLYEQTEKLPEEIKNIARENHFAYIFSKAALFIKNGAEQYRVNDYYNYPLKSWNEEKLILGCNQIVYNTRGLSPELCLENMTKKEFENLFNLFHFEISGLEKTQYSGIVKGIFKHKVEGYTIIMYCHILGD